jgi:phosphotransferase system  glucose/maltose/N-acetylglucosamine-specific IIC component
MTPKNILGLVVRLAGLASIFAGLLDIAHVVFVSLGFPTIRTYPTSGAAAAAAIYLTIGAVVFFAARWIARLAYGASDGD